MNDTTRDKDAKEGLAVEARPVAKSLLVPAAQAPSPAPDDAAASQDLTTGIAGPIVVMLAFLSATIPNAREFADWVAKTHGSPCHVVYTGGCLGALLSG